jgi:SAM-dependent methyltransferase
MFIEGLLPASRRLARSQLIQMDILNPAIKTRFDVVGMFDVLEHIDDDDQALVKLLDLLKPGGGAIITVPQHPFLWSASDNVACHKRRYSRKDLFEKLSEAGFKTLRIASFISFLLPFLLLSRWKAKVGDENPILREFTIPHNFNVAFAKICDLELLLMKKGLTMPFGGSLVAIAQKPFHR